MTIPCDPKLFTDLCNQDRISGTDSLGGFGYDLDLSVPFVTTAIHAGHRVRNELVPLMAISEKDRLSEEDTATDLIIRACPSRIWGLDSRAEYDLNRPPELALPVIPEMFWDTRVYESSPTDAMNRRSLEKYAAFYRFAATVVKVLLNRFGACIFYDIHSYNIQRQVDKGHRAPPVFNLGTRGIDRAKWEKPVAIWLDRLGQIKVPGCLTTVAENDVFGGMGEFCRRLTHWDPNIIVLSTEISKIYMDEPGGVVHNSKIQALKNGLAEAVIAHGQAFQQLYGR